MRAIEDAPRRRTWAGALGAALVAVLLAGVIAAVVIGGREESRTVTITQVAPPPTTTATPPPTAPPVTAAVAPQPTSLPPATEGSLRFVLEGSSFEGATIRVGDRTLTASELREPLAMAAGTFTVHVERDGYRTWENEIVISAGRESSVTPELVRESSTPRTPAAPPATLSINTRPWSRVWIGSRELGTTPIGEATVPSGTVRLRIVDRDGRTFNRSVRVAAGATENVFFDLDAE